MKLYGNIKLILFDVDGTIFNSDEVYYRLLSKELRNYNIKISPSFYALHGLDDCIHELNLPKTEIDRIKEKINKNYYSGDILKKIKFKKDVKKTIQSLAEKYKLAIASGEKLKQIESYLEVMGIKHLFDYIGHGQMVEGRKNNPDYFKMILNHFNLTEKECIFIGDSLFDAKAVEFGIKTIIVPSTFTKYQVFPKTCIKLNHFKDITREL
jgi:HAD superfamily hydrolase (TIGR01549 family)